MHAGGTAYGAHCFSDTNGKNQLAAGIDYVDRYFPKSYIQNGNEAISVDHADFSPYDSVTLDPKRGSLIPFTQTAKKR